MVTAFYRVDESLLENTDFDSVERYFDWARNEIDTHLGSELKSATTGVDFVVYVQPKIYPEAKVAFLFDPNKELDTETYNLLSSELEELCSLLPETCPWSGVFFE